MADRPLQLCVIEGDGVGHEVIPAALDVLAATKLVFDIRHAEAGWACFQAHGTALPEATLDVARHADAVLFGAVSSPTLASPSGRRLARASIRWTSWHS